MHLVALEIGDVQPPRAVEAGAAADTAVGKRGEGHGRGRAGAEFADDPITAKVHGIQGAGGVDGGPSIRLVYSPPVSSRLVGSAAKPGTPMTRTVNIVRTVLLRVWIAMTAPLWLRAG